LLLALNALLWNETDETTAVFSKKARASNRERILQVEMDEAPKKKTKRAGGVGGTAIAVLLAGNYTEEVEKLCDGLNTLSFLLGDSPEEDLAPVLVFQGGDALSYRERARISQSTNRRVQFSFADLSSVPYGFLPSERTTESDSDLKTQQATRFWISEVWKLPILDAFDTVLKISVDSCFRKFNEQFPTLDQRLDYHARFSGADFPRVDEMKNLHDFVLRYIKDEHITPRNPKMWDYFQTRVETRGQLPSLDTNFELIRKSFMKRVDVAKWNKALTETDPFGVLRWDWSQGVLRFLTAAIFLEDGEIRTSDAVGYYRGEDCSAEVIRLSLEFFQ